MIFHLNGNLQVIPLIWLQVGMVVSAQLRGNKGSARNIWSGYDVPRMLILLLWLFPYMLHDHIMAYPTTRLANYKGSGGLIAKLADQSLYYVVDDERTFCCSCRDCPLIGGLPYRPIWIDVKDLLGFFLVSVQQFYNFYDLQKIL